MNTDFIKLAGSIIVYYNYKLLSIRIVCIGKVIYNKCINKG